MNLIDRITINRFHDDRAKKYGAGTLESLGWPDKPNQTIRYEVLSQLAQMDGSTVLDVGCGHGDLYPFLQGKFTGIRYMGIDNNPALLDIATERYGKDEQATFLLGDFTGPELPSVDYILCCGALNYRSQEADFITNSIAKLFRTCRYGLAFNLLHRVQFPDGILVAYDPPTIVAFCQTLTPHVRLQEGYLPEDFSVFLYHEGGKATHK